jgi:signal transduction histidine kinase
MLKPSKMADNHGLKWRFDVNTFRLLGRELITDRITAVFELVKNSYDANATRVDVVFENVSEKSSKGRITISDNGLGMSFSDIRDKWMVVGTASKRNELYSPPPFNRRYVGEKGIGRFAVDKLGAKVRIKTKKILDEKRLIVDINWEEYEKMAMGTQLTLFTDVENTYEFEKAPVDEQGTSLIITSIEETWSNIDLQRLEKELEKIISPFRHLNPKFEIFLTSNEFSEYKEKLVKPDPVKFATHHIKVSYDQEEELQEVLDFDKANGRLVKKKVPKKKFGPIELELYYFNEAGKKKYNTTYKNDDSRIDGIKIYRDGLVTTPFAEFESKRDKRRDILGIDKRLWSGFLDKVGTREIIGVLDITKEKNPKIIDATNRQDFVDNVEYRELKEFVIGQLNVLSELKKFEREKNRTATTIALEKAKVDVKNFSKVITELEKEQPTLKKVLEPLMSQARQIDISIAKGITEQKKERKEHVRKENMYLSLMSLQEYAVHVSHAVRTSLGKVKRLAEFFKTNFPNAKYESLFSQYAVMIFDEMQRLNKVIDFMLSYAASNVEFEEFNVKDLIQDLFLKSYQPVFEHENINAQIEVRDNFMLTTNKKHFEDIFQNLISNSLKVLKNQEEKKIKCTGYIEEDHFILYFSDNGPGIEQENEEKIFEIYHTTTADRGGAGVGLFIVKTRVESLNGKVKVVENEFKPTGATFKITFPFKKI